MTQNDQTLTAAWERAKAAITDPYELAGVTYHGPDMEWVASVALSATHVPGGPEGWGRSPMEALDDLIETVKRESGMKSRAVAQSDDELEAAWARANAAVTHPYELNGVVYHGPDVGWVAFANLRATHTGSGPTGSGASPVDALNNLIESFTRGPGTESRGAQ